MPLKPKGFDNLAVLANKKSREKVTRLSLPRSVKIPSCNEISSPEDEAPETPAPLDAILLVDDEASLLDVFVSALSPHFECVTANSSREAEFELRKRDFKVVICDHLMPGGNGMSFLVRAREEYPYMQRILVTGYMKPEMLLRSVNEAALFRYLLKPVSLVELVKVTQEAVQLHDQSVG